MNPPRPWLVVFAAAVAAAGFDVVPAARPGCGFGPLDVLPLFAVGLAGWLVLAGWAIVLPVQRVPGLVGAAVVGIHMLVGLRQLYINTPLRGPLGLALVVVPLVALAAGWLGSTWVARLGERFWWVLMALGGLAVGVGALRLLPTHTTSASAVDAPNLLYVTIDTLRADRAYDEALAPNLAALMRQGVVYEQAIAAAPLTGPSHLALLTGILPLTSGVVANGTPIGPQPALLSTTLQEQGYDTGAVVGGFPLHRRFGYDQGFDVFDSDFSPLPGLGDLAPVQLVQLLVTRNVPRERRADAVNERGMRFLSSAQEPFFLWAHYYDPHAPYTAPEPFSARGGAAKSAGEALPLPAWWPDAQRDVTDADWLRAQYDAEVAWTDDQLGALVAAARAASTRELRVVVVADHGEGLGEHGVWFDHGDDLYDPALRVPMVFSSPSLRPQHISVQVSTVDLVPTVLDWLGVEDATPRDGRSRLSELLGGVAVDGDALSTTVGGRRENPPIDHSLRRPSGKCWFHQGKPPTYFDYAVDPAETQSAYGDAASGVLCAALGEKVRHAAVQAGAGDADTLKMLEQLGYLDEGPR